MFPIILSYIDLYGLFELPSLPQGVVDASAGMGAFSQGPTDLIRDAMGTNDTVDKCSGAYFDNRMS